MASWDVVDRDTYNRFLTIMEILQDDEDLLEFLFDPVEARLREGPEQTLALSRGYSSGQQILIQVGLDIWCGEGHTDLSKILEKLDDTRFCRVLRGLLTSRGHSCDRQLKLPTIDESCRQ